MFTSKDRFAFNSMKAAVDNLNKWKPGVDTQINKITAIETKANQALSGATSAATTAQQAMAKANQALTGVTSAATTGLNAMDKANEALSGVAQAGSNIDNLRNHVSTVQTSMDRTAEEVSAAVLAVEKRVNEVAVMAGKGGPDLTAAVNNLKADMDAIKLSILIQTCDEMGTQDGDLRKYTQEECDAMNGIYTNGGNCAKKEGGSFSSDCGKLYKGNPLSTQGITKLLNTKINLQNVGGPPPVPAPAQPAAKIPAVSTSPTVGITSSVNSYGEGSGDKQSAAATAREKRLAAAEAAAAAATPPAATPAATPPAKIPGKITYNSSGNRVWPQGQPYYGEYSLEELMADPYENAYIIALRLGLGTVGVRLGFSIAPGSNYNTQELQAADQAFLDALLAKRSPTEAAYAAAAAASKLRANSQAAATSTSSSWFGGRKKRTRRSKRRKSGTRKHRK